MYLSIIVPCFNEEKNIKDFYKSIKKNFADEKYNYEIIFINDGSKDNTKKELNNLLKEKDNIKLIHFSRNFGKEAAMLAGLKNAEGDFVTIIDADLQQNPKYIKEMLKILEENKEYDSVAAYQEKRKEGRLLTFFKSSFYKLINKVADITFEKNASDFRVFRKKVVDAIVSIKEYHRFSKGIFSFVGFNTYYMPYEVEERNAGTTTWSFIKLFKYALEGIISYTTSPLKISYIFSVSMFLSSLIYLILILINHLKITHIIIMLMLFISGLIFLVIGILGSYLSKIYIQSKDRPIYIIGEQYSSHKGSK